MKSSLGTIIESPTHDQGRETGLDISEILPEQLWIGAAPTQSELAELKKVVRDGLVVMDLNRSEQEREWCRDLGIIYEEKTPKIADDGTPVPVSQLRLVARLVDHHIGGGRKVFLHCGEGRGRSPTCAAAYLIHGGMSLSQAKNMVSSRRPVWTEKDADYAGRLEELAEMQEISRASEPF